MPNVISDSPDNNKAENFEIKKKNQVMHAEGAKRGNPCLLLTEPSLL